MYHVLFDDVSRYCFLGTIYEYGTIRMVGFVLLCRAEFWYTTVVAVFAVGCRAESRGWWLFETAIDEKEQSAELAAT